MKTTTVLEPRFSALNLSAPLRTCALASLLLFGAHTAAAQTTNYNFTSADGLWGVPSNWDQNAVPNDITNTASYINSGTAATVNGSYSTGYVYIGSSGSLTISGSGASLNIGNLGANQNGMSIAGGGGQVIVEDGATLSATGSVYLGGTASPTSPTHPRITVTNATVNFGTLAFYGPDDNVQAEVVLNEGAHFHVTFTGSSNSNDTTLIFNGGASGFGQFTGNNFYADRVSNLAINAGSYTGEGTFTLIDISNNWYNEFNTISFNGTAYTLGTDVDYNGYTWNIDRSGTDLVMSVTVPESSTFASLLGLSALLSVWALRRKKA
jgi:hypothetical protein